MSITTTRGGGCATPLLASPADNPDERAQSRSSATRAGLGSWGATIAQSSGSFFKRVVSAGKRWASSRGQVLADQALIMPKAIERGRIEEVIALIECGVVKAPGIVIVEALTVAHGDVHTAKADGGNGEWT